MGFLSEYAYGLIGGGIICAMIHGLMPKGVYGSVLKLLCGLFFTLSVLHPLTQLNLSGILSQWENPQNGSPEAATAFGEEFSRNYLARRIKTETEEYILDKAAAMGASVQAWVTLSEEDIPVPVKAELSGSVSEELQTLLQQILEEDLNISKENQIWTEGNSAGKQ